MAYQFNGTNQDLRTSSAPVNAQNSPLTIAVFVNLRGSLTAFNGICAINDSNNAYTLFTTNLGKIGASHSSVSTNTFGAISTNSISQNTWFHAAAVIPSISIRSVFLNGDENQNTTSLSSINASTNVSIGSRRASGSFGLFGNIFAAEMGIWNAALTAAEIASLAKGMTCDKVRPQSLVFYAPLVRDLIDAKGGLTITNNNGATVAQHPRVYA
jgi:hypothetical protein